ncbi:choline transporter-like protein 4 [Macrotis lagotis]|uniref:choline transporter-like protein 4 n=1 Tax=Macrotis lagotis TaxID=92651 RepID=UPI003D69A057
MGKEQDEKEAYGKPVKYDPTFRGPIKNRSCTDVICCVLFLVFIAGYIVVGIVAWLYGDPRQVLYPRNSTGAYCGIGENREKPYLYNFNIFSCITAISIVSTIMDAYQCPTTQICVSSCPNSYWRVNPNQLSQSVKDVSNFSLFCQPSVNPDMTVSLSLQLELCPAFLLPSAPALGRCIPSMNHPDSSLNTSNIEGINGFMDTLNAREISTKIFEDIAQSWYWILIALAISLALSLLFLLLLRLLVGPMVLVLILGVLGVLAYGIYHCWMQYKTLRNKGATISQLGLTTNISAYQNVQETWLAALIVVSVLEGILLLLLIFLRQRIRIAIALLEEASKAVGHMMSTLFYPLLTFVLLVICVAYWIMTALYLATSGQPQYGWWVYNNSDPVCQGVINKTCDPLSNFSSQLNFSIDKCPDLTCQFLGYSSSEPAQRSLFNLQIYGILGLLWTLNWVLALGQCVLAGAFASFYWAFNKPQDIPSCVLSAAFIRTLRYHTGSLAFGALILSLVQIVRIVLEYLDHKLSGARNSLIRCLMCCLKCCFWCLEKFLKFLNRNAYIMIALYGKNFCISAKTAFMLLMRNVVRVVVLDKVTDMLLFFGKLMVVSGVGILSFFFFTDQIQIPALKKEFHSPELNYYWLPIMVTILGAYVIASGFFNVFSMCVDTLFLCFLEDLERNDGSLARPYYMPKNLMKILGKKNERPPRGKKPPP